MSKTIHDLDTPRTKVQQALNLRKEGNSKAMVAKQVGVSRKSIQNWSKWGILTDGEPWDEYIEKQQELQKQEAKQEKLEVHAEEIEDYYDNIREQLRTALKRITRHMAEGNIQMESKDAERIMDMLNRLDNRDEQLQALLNRALRSWFMAATEILGEAKFRELLAKKKEIEVNMLEEMNPEAAKQLAEENNLDVEFDE